MPADLKAIISAIIYSIFSVITYLPLRKRYRNKKTKVSMVYLLIIPLMWAWFQKFVNGAKIINGGDRDNYLQDFNGRLTGYVGFDYYLQIAHLVTNDFYKVLYFTTFICCVLVAIAYLYSKDSNPNTMLILFCTPFVLNTFVNLKQCLAGVFATIMFSLLSRPSSIKRDTLCIICIIFACSFHPCGYLLIPLFFLSCSSNRVDIRMVFIVTIILAFFLQPVALFVAKNTSSLLPKLSYKLTEYFMENSTHENDGSNIAFIKATPYYIATALGFMKRKQCMETDEKYDMYLFILMVSSVSYACSIVSYWLIRLMALLYFPNSIAIYKIISAERNPKKRLMQYIVIVGGIAFFTIRSLMLNIINYGGY